MNNKAKIHAAKFVAYILLIVLLYVLQSTPGFLNIFGIKPNLVAGAAIIVAMLEGEFIGGLYGAFAGTLCDLGSPSIFGFNAVILLICCVIAGLLTIYMLRVTVINYVLLMFVCILVRGLLEYLLDYAIWGYENVSIVLVRQTLPNIFYSAAVSPLVYYLFTGIRHKFETLIQS